MNHLDGLGSNAMNQSMNQAFGGNFEPPGEGGYPPSPSPHRGEGGSPPRLTGQQIAKVGVMFTLIEAIASKGVQVEPLRSFLRAAAMHQPYDCADILDEAVRVNAECHGKRVLTGKELADCAGILFGVVNTPVL